MGKKKKSISVTLTRDELLDLFLDKKVKISIPQEDLVVFLNGANNHQVIPGMIENESVIHQFETVITVNNCNFQSIVLLKMDTGAMTFSGELQFDD